MEGIRYQAETLGEPVTKFAVASDFTSSTLAYRQSTREHTDLLEKFNRYLKREQQRTRQITGAFSFSEGCAD